MVKLAQTIGSSDIGRSMRQNLHLGGHVIEVRQNLYSDYQEKDAARVFPFSDITYSGAEVASTNSIIASCFVPVVTGVQPSNEGVAGIFGKMPVRKVRKNQTAASRSRSTEEGDDDKRPMDNSLEVKFKRALNTGDESAFAKAESGYLGYGPGMADYMLGIGATASLNSLTASDAHGERRTLLSPDWIRLDDARDRMKALQDEMSKDVRNGLQGTNPVYITQFASEDEALDLITRRPSDLILGYVIGPRDVKMYYTEAAVAMMARRLRRIVTLLGSRKPIMMPIGLGHLALDEAGTPWTPGMRRKGTVLPPSLKWDVGSVAYKATALRAKGSIHIPSDQIPYPTMRRNFKVNHILTQLGLEVLEAASAIGIDLNDNLQMRAPKERTWGCKSGSEVSALQMLFGSMFGFTSSASPINDPVIDEVSVASSVKEHMGLLFSSGHVHVDPGVFAYKYRAQDATGADDWKISDKKTSSVLKFKGNGYSQHMMMVEFIGRYMTFCTALAALGQYMSVPLVQAHWLYIGHPKVEYVTEQMQMNFRSDVYFDGDHSMPFTLIPTRLNPGEILDRLPCYFDMDGSRNIANKYLGIRSPTPYGPVQEIRFHGDKPTTVVEEKDYTFSPVIEGDATVITQSRNNRTINAAVWPRPTHYSPGSTRLGLVYGLMHDNARVAGHYYYAPTSGSLNEGGNVYFRAMGGAGSKILNSGTLQRSLEHGFSEAAEARRSDYFAKRVVPPEVNPQNVESPGPAVFPLGTEDNGDTNASPIV